MNEKLLKKWPTCLAMRECNSKPPSDFILHLQERLRSITEVRALAGEDAA